MPTKEQIRRNNQLPSAHNAREKWKYKLFGVYALYDKGICLYIGKSKRMLHRFADHMSYVKNPNSSEHKKNQLYPKLAKHDYFYYGQLDKDMSKEQYYIDTLKPLYNKDRA